MQDQAKPGVRVSWGSAAPKAAMRRPLRRQPFKAYSTATTTAVPMTDVERQALEEYKRAALGLVDKASAVALLTKAAQAKVVPPPQVEGALVWLEQACLGQTGQLNPSGRWLLPFSTATKIRAFQYIPVKEEFVLNFDANSVALESVIGPFNFYIRGVVHSWSPDTNELNFQFNAVDAHFLGNKVWSTSPKTQAKTYTFFYVDKRIAAARSSAGGLSLLCK